MVRALLAVIVAVLSVGLAASKAGFAAVGGAIGVRVGVPGAAVELTRVVLPVLVALLFAVYALRFAYRALRANVTLGNDFARGGKLLGTVAWAAWGWLVFELLYGQLWLGWATVFGNLGLSLALSALAVALCFVADALVPWSRAPRGLRHFGLLVVIAVALVTALSAWSHREVVPPAALIPVAAVALGLAASGVRRAETGPRGRMLVELGLASTLLSGPVWSLFA